MSAPNASPSGAAQLPLALVERAETNELTMQASVEAGRRLQKGAGGGSTSPAQHVAGDSVVDECAERHATRAVRLAVRAHEVFSSLAEHRCLKITTSFSDVPTDLICAHWCAAALHFTRTSLTVRHRSLPCL